MLFATIPTAITYRRLLIFRILAVCSFTAHVCYQAYLLSLRGPASWTPYSSNDTLVVTFLSASVLLNIFWLRHLFFTWDVAGDTMPLTFGWREELTDERTCPQPVSSNDGRIFGANLCSTQVRCLPFNIAGNIFFAGSSYAWLQEYYLISQILLACNLSAYLYAVFMLLHVEQDDAITPDNFISHLVMKTGVGLAILYMWKNWSWLDQGTTPALAPLANTGVIFVLMTVGSGPDPTVGICLLYDLAALLSEETSSELWCHTFLWIMLSISICLLIDLWLSMNDDFSWLKGFDGSVALSRGRLGQIALERDVEKNLAAYTPWNTPQPNLFSMANEPS
ncbi:hypothetical protein GALMADRAFT_149954 [Galerina marginata CBS 339.88]|uniref:Uncharacterized protein n=1 Tax=Galerina marginata (strain CBS 339.88) TaxID=685588 RepID=A0A067TQS0_GALM3|nr:hypothetical protein GALMADRAFT_149954 [Galerina marginata CBS 339.88]